MRWHGGALDATAIAHERRIASFTDGAVRCARFTRLPAILFLAYRNTPLFQRLIPYVRPLIKALRGDRLTWAYIRQRLAFEMRRPFKRMLFWYCVRRKDLDLFDPLHLSFRSTAGRREVSDALFSASSPILPSSSVSDNPISRTRAKPSARYEPKEKCTISTSSTGSVRRKGSAVRREHRSEQCADPVG